MPLSKAGGARGEGGMPDLTAVPPEANGNTMHGTGIVAEYEVPYSLRNEGGSKVTGQAAHRMSLIGS